MPPESVCRLCLVTDVPMQDIADSPLRDIYEKLTDIYFQAGDGPVAACYLCHSQLRKCRALMTKAKTAYKLLVAIQQSGVMVSRESIAMINREAYRLNAIIDPRHNVKIKNEILSYDDMEIITNEALIDEENIKCELLYEVEDNMNDSLRNGRDMGTEVSEQTEDVQSEVFIERSNIHNNYIKPEISDSIEECEIERLTNSIDYEMLDDADDIIRESVENVESEVLTAVRDIDHVISEDEVDNEFDSWIDIEDMKLEYTHDGAAPVQQSDQPYNNITTDNENTTNKPRRKTYTEGNEDVTEAILSANKFRHSDIVVKSYLDINSVDHDEPNVAMNIDNNNTYLQTKFICDYCCSKFENKYLLIEHITECHKIAKIVTGDKERPFKCTVCDKRYIKNGFLIRHLKRHAVNKENVTSGHISTRILQDKTNVINNRQDSENISEQYDVRLKKTYFVMANDNENSTDNSENNNLQTKCICDHCGCIFNNKELLIEHIRQHNCNRLKINLSYKDRPYGCNICEKRFTKKGFLARHTKTHYVEHKNVQKRNGKSNCRSDMQKKTYECSVCPRILNNKSNLEVHSRIHNKSKPYKCKICERKFRQIGHLNVHLRTHTGEKPFECTICRRKFRQKYDMKIHLKIHTGDKPFECSLCESKFRQKQHLTSHIITHTSKQPFECTICNGKFKRKDYLIRHLRSHTGDKPFECEICLRSFSLKTILNKHLRTHIKKSTF